MNTFNLNSKETFLDLSAQDQEGIKSFLANCSPEEMVAVRLQDSENGECLYGCYSLTADEYYSYMQSGGTWSHIPAKKIKSLIL